MPLCFGTSPCEACGERIEEAPSLASSGVMADAGPGTPRSLHGPRGARLEMPGGEECEVEYADPRKS